MLQPVLNYYANEAAIRAVRENHDQVTMKDFEGAIDHVITGPEKRHRVLNAEEKRRVAFQESGHALVAERVPTGEPVHKVAIIPRCRRDHIQGCFQWCAE